MPDGDSEKVEVVRVGTLYYLSSDWVSAFHTIYLVMLEERLSSVRTLRQSMRVVRGMKDERVAKNHLIRTMTLIELDGNPVELNAEMEVVARFPGVSDPSAKVGVD